MAIVGELIPAALEMWLKDHKSYPSSSEAKTAAGANTKKTRKTTPMAAWCIRRIDRGLMREPYLANRYLKTGNRLACECLFKPTAVRIRACKNIQSVGF